MLYATLRYVSAALFFLLNKQRIYGAYIQPNLIAYQDVHCGNAPQDTCLITCDLSFEGKQWERALFPNVYCGNTTKCIIHCVEDSCLRGSMIHANHTTHLEVVSQGGKQCVQDASLYLPNHGNATISADSNGIHSNILKGLILHSGTHTNEIDIHCSDTWDQDTKNDCDDIQIYAQTAQYFEMTIDGASSDNTMIFCPENSTLSPSCIINVRNASSAYNIQIYASKGTPQDVMFNTNPAGSIYWGTTIYCFNGTAAIAGTTFIGTPCFITLSPTAHPSVNPSRNPSMNPSRNPSINPSANPSTNPSTNPSVDPSMSPSRNPSIMIDPTIGPTQFPSRHPVTTTQTPTLVISLPTISHVQTTTISDVTDAQSSDDDEDDMRSGVARLLPAGMSFEIALFSLIAITIFVAICVFALYVARMKKKRQQHMNSGRKETDPGKRFAKKEPRQGNTRRETDVMEPSAAAAGMETPGIHQGENTIPQSLQLAAHNAPVAERGSVVNANALRNFNTNDARLRPRNIIQHLTDHDDENDGSKAVKELECGECESDVLSDRTDVFTERTDSELLYVPNEEYTINEIHRNTKGGLDGEPAPAPAPEEPKEESAHEEMYDGHDDIVDMVIGTIQVNDPDDLLIGADVGSF